MRIIHRYIGLSFVQTFAIAFAVLTFLLMLGFLFKATSLIAAGASAHLFFTYLWSGLPATFTFTLPIGALVSMMLLFGKLNGDSEIIAMKTMGIRLLSITKAPIFFCTLLSAFCFYTNGFLAPESKYARREIRRLAGIGDLLSLLEPERYTTLPNGLSVFIGARDGNELTDVRINETLPSGAIRTTSAKRAVARETGKNRHLVFELYNVAVNPIDEGRIGLGRADRAVWDAGEVLGKAPATPYARRIKDTNTRDLVGKLIQARRDPGFDSTERSRLRTEVASRTALSLACLAFCLIAAPLATIRHKHESVAGVVGCLVVILVYYVLIIAADTLAGYPAIRPDLLALAPPGVAFALAAALMVRNP